MQNSVYSRDFQGAPQTGSGTTIPQFFMDSVQDGLASESAGRPIFKDIERVKILMPGNQLNAPVHNVTDVHRQRWPEAYKAFKEGYEVAVDGTPLEQWNILTKSQVYELKGMHLRTVEDVARIPDNVLTQIPFGRRIREEAAAYLDDAAASALTTKLSAENDRMNSRLAELEKQNAELRRHVDQMFSELQARRNAPDPILTTIPASLDPMEQMKAGQRGVVEPSSSLDNFAPRRRGRPPRNPDASEAA